MSGARVAPKHCPALLPVLTSEKSLMESEQTAENEDRNNNNKKKWSFPPFVEIEIKTNRNNNKKAAAQGRL